MNKYETMLSDQICLELCIDVQRSAYLTSSLRSSGMPEDAVYLESSIRICDDAVNSLIVEFDESDLGNGAIFIQEFVSKLSRLSEVESVLSAPLVPGIVASRWNKCMEIVFAEGKTDEKTEALIGELESMLIISGARGNLFAYCYQGAFYLEAGLKSQLESKFIEFSPAALASFLRDSQLDASSKIRSFV